MGNVLFDLPILRGVDRTCRSSSYLLVNLLKSLDGHDLPCVLVFPEFLNFSNMMASSARVWWLRNCPLECTINK